MRNRSWTGRRPVVSMGGLTDYAFTSDIFRGLRHDVVRRFWCDAHGSSELESSVLLKGARVHLDKTPVVQVAFLICPCPLGQDTCSQSGWLELSPRSHRERIVSGKSNPTQRPEDRDGADRCAVLRRLLPSGRALRVGRFVRFPWSKSVLRRAANRHLLTRSTAQEPIAGDVPQTGPCSSFIPRSLAFTRRVSQSVFF